MPFTVVGQAKAINVCWRHPHIPGVCCAGFSWKGQTAAISQLLCVLVGQAADPSQELLSLVNDALSAMPDKVPSKEQLDPVAGFAALCSATFATWYK